MFSEFFSLFVKGGLVMYPLLVLSIIVVSVAVERYLYYREAQTSSQLMPAIQQCLDQGDWNAALKKCEQHTGCIAEILKTGMKRQDRSLQGLQNVLEGTASYATGKLREKLNYLETVVTMAPLLGLLGTVVGMIQSFSVLNIKTGQPMAITGGVGEALIATATGLCVAIAALIVHTYYSHRLDGIVTDIEQACTILIDAAARGEQR